MKWLILVDPTTADVGDGLPFGGSWSVVEGDTPEDAVTEYEGAGAAWDRDFKVWIVEWPKDGPMVVSTSASFIRNYEEEVGGEE